jgi:hypothetical protein
VGRIYRETSQTKGKKDMKSLPVSVEKKESQDCIEWIIRSSEDEQIIGSVVQWLNPKHLIKPYIYKCRATGDRKASISIESPDIDTIITLLARIHTDNNSDKFTQTVEHLKTVFK